MNRVIILMHHCKKLLILIWKIDRPWSNFKWSKWSNFKLTNCLIAMTPCFYTKDFIKNTFIQSKMLFRRSLKRKKTQSLLEIFFGKAIRNKPFFCKCCANMRNIMNIHRHGTIVFPRKKLTPFCVYRHIDF